MALLAIALASTFSTSGALADYRLSAFSDTAGFRALVKKDTAKAKETFASRKLEDMDYFEANNLCIAQILLEEFDEAIESCSTALELVETSSELTVSNERVAIAAVYSNLAVAKAMAGDKLGASADLEIALSLNGKDDNARINYDLISTNLLAGS